MGFAKGNQTQVYTAFAVCARKEADIPGRGYSELCTAASRADLLRARRNPTRSNCSDCKSITSAPSWIWNLKVIPKPAICKSKCTMSIYDGIGFIQGDIFHSTTVIRLSFGMQLSHVIENSP